MENLNTQTTNTATTATTAQSIPAWQPHLPAIAERLKVLLTMNMIDYRIKNNKIYPVTDFADEAPVLLDQAVEEVLGNQVHFVELMKIGRLLLTK